MVLKSVNLIRRELFLALPNSALVSSMPLTIPTINATTTMHATLQRRLSYLDCSSTQLLAYEHIFLHVLFFSGLCWPLVPCLRFNVPT